jgi:hypothetical protein
MMLESRLSSYLELVGVLGSVLSSISEKTYNVKETYNGNTEIHYRCM